MKMPLHVKMLFIKENKTETSVLSLQNIW